MRRLLLVNALIFAVLAAAAALAYYGYLASASETASERELALMQDLAEEKVLNIEFVINDKDTSLMTSFELDEVAQLREGDWEKKIAAAKLTVESVIVLDEELKIVPGGRQSNRPSYYRDWFLTSVLPQLRLSKALETKRRYHYHFTSSTNTPYLFSYMRRESGGRTFYVVIDDSLLFLFDNVLPTILSGNPKRQFWLVDGGGKERYGTAPPEGARGLVAQQKFTSTWDSFTLHIAQSMPPDTSADRRRRLLNAILIGGAVFVILGGMTVLFLAIRRERRLSELKSEFISNVSHELKTPLSIISMFGEMLAEGRTKGPEQAHEYAEIIWRESVRLGRLIDNVLDFAKIERGMGGYEFAESDLLEVIDRAVEVSKRRVGAAEMTLETELPEELPLLSIDGNALTLAVLNLIDNAIKYAADGKKIALIVRQDANKVVVSVRDWGPGIDPEEHEKVFDRFYRAKAVRLKPIRGSGIGLALVQHIARAHGGEATVESTPGRGSTFSIWLPIDGKR